MAKAMTIFKVFGPRNGKDTWICNMYANNADEALEKARNLFGFFYVDRVESFKDVVIGGGANDDKG